MYLLFSYKNIYLHDLSGLCWIQDRIARFMDVHPKTLRKHYSRRPTQFFEIIEGGELRVIAARMLDGNFSAARRMLDPLEMRHAAVPQPSTSAEGSGRPSDRGSRHRKQGLNGGFKPSLPSGTAPCSWRRSSCRLDHQIEFMGMLSLGFTLSCHATAARQSRLPA